MSPSDVQTLLGELYPHRARAIDAKRLKISVSLLNKIVSGARRPSPELAARISAETGGLLSMEMLCRWEFEVPDHARAFERDPCPSRYPMAQATGTEA